MAVVGIAEVARWQGRIGQRRTAHIRAELSRGEVESDHGTTGASGQPLADLAGAETLVRLPVKDDPGD